MSAGHTMTLIEHGVISGPDGGTQGEAAHKSEGDACGYRQHLVDSRCGSPGLAGERSAEKVGLGARSSSLS